MKKKLKYQMVKEALLKGIRDGEIGEGEVLPSERELCEMFGVSRVTVRKAVEELESEGIIYKFQGKGSFVKNPQKITQVLSRLTSFTEDMQAQSMKPSSKILLTECTAANEEVAEKLGIAPGSEVILLRRLRLADEIPMAIETIYLDHTLLEPVLTEFSEGSLYTFMRDRLGIVPTRAVQSIEVAKLMKWEAALLDNVDLKIALLMNRQTFDASDQPIEYVISKYRADRYKFHIELSIPEA